MNMEELLNDQSFRESLEKVESLAEAVKLLKSKGLEVTEEELKAAIDAPEGELDENALKDVAGGASLPSWLRRISRILGGPIMPIGWR